MNDFNKYGVEIPKILLPKKGSDFKAWSVIACDQYTQDRDYWARCEKNAEGKPSCINLILPEVYLNDADKADRIAKIHKNMDEYVANGVFAPEEAEFVYIERKTAYGRVRKGLIVAIDLETYEWKPFSKALVRATEATIVDRIPPRMEIRRGAPLESPHIMLLVNDADKELVEKSGELAKNAEPIYETDLMENSGSIKGYAIKEGAALDCVKAALEKLYAKNTSADGSVFMFAVGDGNHSLATAKAVWDELKEKNGGLKKEDGTVSIPAGFENHNARFALTEIVNIYDDGLTLVNGHAYKAEEKKTKNTNFAILSTTRFTEPFNQPIEYARYTAGLANMISGGSVIVQRLGDLEIGRRTDAKRLRQSTVQPTLKGAVPGDLSLCMPKRQLDNIIEMLHALNNIAPGTANYDTLLYGIECKYYGARPETDDEFRLTGKENYFAIGDGAGFTRSLAQAAAQGLMVADTILKENK